jgi:hypothetical protein
MKKFRVFVLILLIALAVPFALQHRAWALHFWQSGQSSVQPVQSAALRIIAPKDNEKIAQAYVVAQYQQVAPASAASTPTYELRLDARDPVHTTDTSYTFNGLTPGTHELGVQIVDANGTPVLGTSSKVKFQTVNPPAGGGVTPGPTSSLPPLPSDLPMGNSSLPLLSVIGFGILVGGVISALRTRPAHK